MTEAEAAWLAGLFEGEGTIGTFFPKGRAKPYPNLRLKIAMRDEDVIWTVKRLVGSGAVNCYQQSGRAGTMWVHCVQGKAASEVVKLIRPWLHGRRKEQVDNAIALWETALAES